MYNSSNIGSFLIRLVLGVIFLAHGYAKFQGGIENTAGFFSSLGMPGFAAYIVALIELVGGILIVLGLATRIIAILFAVVMIGAILMVNLRNGLLGGYELDLALLAMSIYLVLNKEQALSLDSVIIANRKKQETT